MSIAIFLLSFAVVAQAADASPPAAEIVEAAAVKCGLKTQNLRPLEGDDPPSHWTIVPNPDGTLPDYRAFDCFLRWASAKKGLHIGFVAQGPSDGPPPAHEPIE